MLWPLHICIWFLCVADNLASQTFLLFLQDGLPNMPSRILTDEKHSRAGNPKPSKQRPWGCLLRAPPPAGHRPGCPRLPRGFGSTSGSTSHARSAAWPWLANPAGLGVFHSTGHFVHPREQQEGLELDDYQKHVTIGMEAMGQGAVELSPVPHTGTHCPGSPLSMARPLQSIPDKFSPSRVMRHKRIWLLFSNYIKAALLKSVPSRDNALDAFDWLEEERGRKAALAHRQVIFLISFLPDEKVLPSHLPRQRGHRASL